MSVKRPVVRLRIRVLGDAETTKENAAHLGNVREPTISYRPGETRFWLCVSPSQIRSPLIGSVCNRLPSALSVPSRMTIPCAAVVWWTVYSSHALTSYLVWPTCYRCTVSGQHALSFFLEYLIHCLNQNAPCCAH